MVSTKTAIASIAATVGVLQMCPAPPAVLGGILGGVAAGAIGGGATLCAKWCPNPTRIKRGDFVNMMARDLPPGVSQESLDQCTAQINDQKNKGISVEISSVDQGTVDVAHVPQACMNLATVLSGNPAQAGGPVPVPMGSDSLRYTGLTGDDRRNLANALGA